MGWKSFAGGVGVGVVLAGAVALWPKAEWRKLVAFPDSNFIGLHHEGLGDGSLEFSGAIVGDDLAFKNNVMKVRCTKDSMLCQSATVNQIAENHIDEPEFEDFKVTQWSAAFVQAVDDALCGKITLNIDRASRHIAYVQEPQNFNDPLCHNAEKVGRRYEIGRPAYWRSLDPHGRSPS